MLHDTFNIFCRKRSPKPVAWQKNMLHARCLIGETKLWRLARKSLHSVKKIWVSKYVYVHTGTYLAWHVTCNFSPCERPKTCCMTKNSVACAVSDRRHKNSFRENCCTALSKFEYQNNLIDVQKLATYVAWNMRIQPVSLCKPTYSRSMTRSTYLVLVLYKCYI